MKQYPSIQREIVDKPIIAFAKNDGNNIRAEWSKKHKGFVKFGSRKVLIDETHEQLGKSINLIKTKYEKDLTDIFKKERYEEVVCFFEFFGPNSFAGMHDPNDTLDVLLFDLDVYKYGLLPPREFIKLTGKIDTPSVLYEGRPTQEFIKSVYDSTLENMPLEGVVCKGLPIKNGYPPLMFKLKSKIWLDKVKEKYKDNWEELI